ncbi:DUF6194 family protein [Spirilliplanes yamanashiensis]|uniref:DUF6194 domain-containing protein n=1 Tax=Spirilliplanes yamanashiensis TaxID=42233 RepID=A0A8J4DGH1_9ACTN|nr:DUF6194 family protein [Spirilliplanes yamanashiensis]MDP9814345.1 hypothetical protein [Spirilliplanes yamanashiensis]GIJ00673.1 hypothetical protein Sya03_00250 [Spirilliplanes yamanashiensis]
MDAAELTAFIRDRFPGTRVLEADGDSYLLYDPDADLPPERQMPYATVVTGDRHDTASQLDRPGFFRLNVGLTKAGYAQRVGAVDGPVDHTVTDVVLPHPVYAGQHWVCVVNPSHPYEELLAEAHAFAARKHANQRARRA